MNYETLPSLHPDGLLKKYDPENKLEHYFRLLLEENKRVNLVSRETGEAGVGELKKLAAQSLVPFEIINLGTVGSYLDIGSGGGFPAVPILMTLEVSPRRLLVERTQKKAAALRRILLKLDIRAELAKQTFEEVAIDAPFDLITLRLVKLTPQLFDKIFSALTEGGIFIYYAIPDFEMVGPSLSHKMYRYSTVPGGQISYFTLFRKTS